MHKKEIYFNPAQREVMTVSAHTSVIVGGRRIGKSHGINAVFVLRNLQRMPGSSGAFVGSSYKRLLTNTLPGTLNALEQWGYKRGIHWTIGVKPPKHFGKPIITPMSWEHVFAFYNGSIAYLISQDMPGTSNSMTLDWLAIDEAKFIDFEKLKNETFPANGGIKSYFGDRFYHNSILIISDMGLTKKESWFLRYKEECDEDLIELIKSINIEAQYIKNRLKTEKNPPFYLHDKLKKLYTSLARFRRVAVLYREYSSIQNIELLGEAYIRQMKRDLPPLTFQTSIMCKRLSKILGGFYSSMKEGHKYSTSNIDYLQSLEFDLGRINKHSSQMDSDVDPNKSILIAFDYNANINWLVAGQTQRNRLNIIKSFYVKYERKTKELIDDFCYYYRDHGNKTVVFYYDATAKGHGYALNDRDLFESIQAFFEANRWSCIPIYIGNPRPHMVKHQIINEMFDGRRNLTPYINKDNNEDLVISLELTGVRNGQKDKSAEKNMETEENLLEHRTDGSDAFDTLVLGAELYPHSTGIIISSDII